MSAKKSNSSKQPKKDKRVRELEKSVDELTGDLQRLQADFINYKRRAEQDHAMAAGFGKEAAIAALLPVVDNLQRAVDSIPKELADSEYAKGVKSVAKQFMSTLSDMGVQKIETVGQPFDADTMDAVSMDGGKGDKEVVSEEIQAGYILGERVLRHAVVKVRKK